MLLGEIWVASYFIHSQRNLLPCGETRYGILYRLGEDRSKVRHPNPSSSPKSISPPSLCFFYLFFPRGGGWGRHHESVIFLNTLFLYIQQYIVWLHISYVWLKTTLNIRVDINHDGMGPFTPTSWSTLASTSLNIAHVGHPKSCVDS